MPTRRSAASASSGTAGGEGGAGGRAGGGDPAVMRRQSRCRSARVKATPAPAPKKSSDRPDAGQYSARKPVAKRLPMVGRPMEKPQTVGHRLSLSHERSSGAFRAGQ